MNCTEFEDRLHEQWRLPRSVHGAAKDIATDSAGAPDLAEHARQCSACRTLIEQFRLLSECLDAWRAEVPEVDLTPAVVAAHQARSVDDLNSDAPVERVKVVSCAPQRRQSRWFAPRAAATAAALVLAAVTLSLMREGAPPVDRAPGIAGVRQGSPSPARRVRNATERPQPAADVAASLPKRPAMGYLDLAQKAAGALDDATVFVMPGSPSRPAGAEPFAEEAAGWIDGLQHQLRPIGRGLDNAFDFLWQAGRSSDSSNT